MEVVVNGFKIAPFNELCWDVQEWKGARPHHANGGIGGEPKWRSCGRYPSTFAEALEEIARALRIAKKQSAALKRALPESQRIERRIALAVRGIPTAKGATVEFDGYRVACNSALCWEIHEWKAASAHHSNGGVPGEPKWVSAGRYPATLSQALCDVYELLIKRDQRELDVSEAVKRAESLANELLDAAKPLVEEARRSKEAE